MIPVDSIRSAAPIRRSARFLFLLWIVSDSAALGDENADFFESRIRPVLVAQCLECHSRESNPIKGQLRLDSAEAMRRGGPSGPAVVPGKPEDSMILAALAHDGSFVDMPPKGKLPDVVLEDFRRWIAAGAFDPRTEAAASASTLGAKPMSLEESRSHWAFQPIRRPEPPQSASNAGVENPVDAFIRARLEVAGLSPAPPADPRTLIRRAYFDLIGLPPTFEETETFAAECETAVRTASSISGAASSADGTLHAAGAPTEVFERLVDRLLASKHYGERWARHWLDVARYADTKDGVLMYGDARIRPHAFTYRDYVIRAFNDDTPFDRFIVEQLAADLLEPKVSPDKLAALGFLTLGRMFDFNVHDVIDDQIDTVSRGLLGLTVSCARCHDHKYDAVPTADYYSLYGVFARSEVPLELPLIGKTDPSLPGFAEFEKKDRELRGQLASMLDRQYELLTEFERSRAGDYLLDIASVKPDPLENAVFFRSLSADELRPSTMARWRQFVQRTPKDDPVFGPWHELLAVARNDLAEPDRLGRAAAAKSSPPDPGIEEHAPAILERLSRRPKGLGPGAVHPVIWAALTDRTLRSRADVAAAYARAFTSSYDSYKRNAATGAERHLADILIRTDGPVFFPRALTWYVMSRPDKDRFASLRSELDILAAKFPHAPPRAMALVDSPSPMPEPKIFVRGNPTIPGETVPRRFLAVLSPKSRPTFGPGSGRLELAQKIVDPANPLTARVIVNRVWMHLMGDPLVATPSDFGARGSSPTHPELLDWLASTFIASGWSMKDLHRTILLSNTYRQASFDRPECRKVDPDNRLCWRANRRRLDFESMRDAILAASGRLDRTMFGRPVDVAADPNAARRTVYALIDRQSLPALFRAFDFANPDQSIDRRPFTTAPQQALFALNSPFVGLHSRNLAAATANLANADQRIERIYRMALSRNPTSEELLLARRFLDSPEDRWAQFAQTLLASNEFHFVD